MALSAAQKNFIDSIAPLIRDEAIERGYKICSPIIAMACIESAYGQSTLASKYHNYFGMKTGSTYKGPYVELKTKEEYTKGQLTTITAKFRVYNNMADGVKGVFDFLSAKRYENLKGAATVEYFAKMVKVDGYATSSTYTNNIINVVKTLNLTVWDKMVKDEAQVQASIASVEIPKDSELDFALEEVAQWVIKGFFGNGNERKDRIYRAVQDKVNEIVRRKA